jgi:hypothetical protein
LGSTGDNVWDVNSTEADGTHVDGHSPYLFESGTATAGTNTNSETITIADSSKTWSPTDKWRGFTVKRVSDGATVVILNSTATALTGYSRAGLVSNWAVGDSYQIHKVLISQDQACRGKGDLINGDYTTPLNSTTGTATWSHQALEPAYSWNDVYNPGNVPVTIHTNDSTGGFVILQEGRDYFNNSSSVAMVAKYTASLNGVDYTGPYTYPHPLVSGGGGDTTHPTATMTVPSNGATVSGASVTLTATASDDVAVAGVTFKRDGGTVIGSEDTSSPYSVTWDSTSVSNGSHTLYATARDTSNNTGDSSSISVTVSNGGPPPPALIILKR